MTGLSGNSGAAATYLSIPHPLIPGNCAETVHHSGTCDYQALVFADEPGFDDLGEHDVKQQYQSQ
jgi:hypothetical protein